MTTVVRMLTFNVLFSGDARNRLRALGGILAAGEHDIVCLQEVVYRSNAALLHRITRAELPHRAATGFAMLDGGLLILSRWPIVRYRFVRYRMTRPLRTELLMTKGVQAAVVRTPGGDLTVLNTHLSANRDDDWSPGNPYTIVERGELGALARVVAASDPALPLVATGDFNVPRGTALLDGFIAGAGLTDLMAGDTSPTYRPTPRWPDPPAFDHVLVRGLRGQAGLALRDKADLPDGRRDFLSDHFAVTSRLHLGA